MGTIYGYWTCDYCGIENCGDKYRCTGCGKNRGKDVEFYVYPKTIKEPQKNAPKSKGPDWHCAYCDSLNSATETVCHSCGHEKEYLSKNYFDLHPEEAGSRSTEQDFADNSINSSFKNDLKEEDAVLSTGKTSFFQNRRLLLLVALGALGTIILLVMLFTLAFPYRTEATILDKTWERAVTIEEYRTFHESGWHIPTGGRETSRYQSIHHYEDVLDHYETVTKSREIPDGGHYEVTGYRQVETGGSYEVIGYTNNGDGTFDEITAWRPTYTTEEVTTWVTDYRTEFYTEQEPVYRSEPVYRTKYNYDIERWVFDHYEITSGSTEEPYYASPELGLNYRANGTSERYEITISCINRKGKTITSSHSLEYAEWSSLKNGDIISVKIYVDGIVSLEPSS